MSSSDRNQKLKNYHARKVRERQLLQQQQQQQEQRENVKNSGSAQPNTAGPARPTVAAASAMKGVTNATATSSSGAAKNYTNNNKNNNNGGRSNTTNITSGNNHATNTSNNNRGKTLPVASSRSSRSLFATATKSTTATTSTAATATTSNSNNYSTVNNKSSVKLNRLVDTKPDKVQKGGDDANQVIVSRGSNKGVVTNNFDKTSSNVATAPPQTNFNSTTNGTNNAMEAARVFAARRRRAQLEMNVKNDTTAVDGSDGSGDGSSVGGGSSSVGSNSSSSKNSRGVIKSGGGVRNGGGGGGTSFATRMAYERYIASNAGGSSVSSATGSGDRTNHFGSSKSSGSDIGSAARTAPSSSTSSAKMMPKSGHNGNTVGGSNSSSNRGGINTMNSMDSADNSTIASVPSAEDYSDNLGLSSSTSTLSNDDIIVTRDSIDNRDDTARDDGLKSLATVREESSTSFSSMATIQVSNTGRNKTVVVSADNGGGVKTPQGDRSDSNGANAVKSDPPAAPTPIHEGILRPPHHHESSKATTAATMGEVEVDGHHSKSVRFHLSPLERQKKIDEDNAKKKRVVTRVAAAPTTEVIVSQDQSLPLNSSSTVVAAENAASGDEQQEDEDFAMFVDGLRREVAGDHTKVRYNFETFMLLCTVVFTLTFSHSNLFK
jgi:hypothetical protein